MNKEFIFDIKSQKGEKTKTLKNQEQCKEWTCFGPQRGAAWVEASRQWGPAGRRCCCRPVAALWGGPGSPNEGAEEQTRWRGCQFKLVTLGVTLSLPTDDTAAAAGLTANKGRRPSVSVALLLLWLQSSESDTSEALLEPSAAFESTMNIMYVFASVIFVHMYFTHVFVPLTLPHQPVSYTPKQIQR